MLKKIKEQVYKLDEVFHEEIELIEELLRTSLELNRVWRNRYEYVNSVNLIIELEERLVELQNEINKSARSRLQSDQK